MFPFILIVCSDEIMVYLLIKLAFVLILDFDNWRKTVYHGIYVMKVELMYNLKGNGPVVVANKVCKFYVLWPTN